MARIVVTENIVGAGMDKLRRDFDVAFEPELWRDAAGLQQRLDQAEAVIVRNQTKVTAQMIAGAKKLKVIGRAGAGLDNIAVAAASEAGVVVAYTPEQNSLSVAELVMGVMLALARKIAAADADTKAGGWKRQAFVGTELYGKTLGVVGFGRIGFLTAMRARAFGMRILGHDEFVNPDAGTVVQAEARMVGIDELLGQADYVSCHLPSTAQTRRFFNEERFGKMKPGACFLNLARGESVDETALIAALTSGHLGAAALDVRESEPPAASALNEMDNVILTPHIAAFTREAQGRVVDAVCADVAAVVEGGRAKNFRNFAQPGNE